MFRKTLRVSVQRLLAPRPLLLCLGLLIAAFGLLGPVHPAAAQAGNPWTVSQTTPSLANSNTYVLWIKSGTTDANGHYSGDMASIWTVNASGQQVSISPTYGPYPGWSADSLIPAFDGTLRMTWTMDTGNTVGTRRDIVSYWALDVSGNRTSISPTYGPYTGWHFWEAFPQPNGTSAFYWVKGTTDSTGKNNGTLLSIWTVDSGGSQLSISSTYGPYPGWYFEEGIPNFNKDGTNYVVWTNPGTSDTNDQNYTGTQISVWKTDSRGNQTSIGPTYGRYPGWYFQGLIPEYDGTARLLWKTLGTYTDTQNSDGSYTSSYSGDVASIWSMDSTGHKTTNGPTYGPYAGWTADSLVPAPAGTSHMLWVKQGAYDINNHYSGDQASIWSLNAADVQTSISPTYTTPGGMAIDGLDFFSDGTSRLPWEYPDTNDNESRLSIWALDASNNRTATGQTYGPF